MSMILNASFRSAGAGKAGFVVAQNSEGRLLHPPKRPPASFPWYVPNGLVLLVGKAITLLVALCSQVPHRLADSVARQVLFEAPAVVSAPSCLLALLLYQPYLPISGIFWVPSCCSSP